MSETKNVDKELREVAKALVNSVKAFVNICVLTKNTKSLNSFAELVDRFVASEVILVINKAGLDDELDKLAEKAGHLPKEET